MLLFSYADNWTCNIPCGCVCSGMVVDYWSLGLAILALSVVLVLLYYLLSSCVNKSATIK